MKTVCIYHSIDLDGWMSAAIVRYWWQKEQNSYIQEGNHITNPNTGEDNLDFIGYNYGQLIPDLLNYDKVIMCDISFPKEELIDLYDRLDRNLIIIDHHKSAIDIINSLEDECIISDSINGLRRIDFAACELTWKYFFPNEEMPELVRLLGRYDCFGHKGTNEEQKVLEFQYGARQVITNYEEAYNYLYYSIEFDYFKYTDDENRPENKILINGKTIYKYLCTEAKQSYKNGFKIKFDYIWDINPINGLGSTVPVKLSFICINKERFNPINFGIDYHKEGYDGCACFHYDGVAKLWRFSLYNDNGNVDCSIIAKQYGGGGHKGASGFAIKDINEMLKPLSL